VSKLLLIVDDSPLVRRLVRTCVEATIEHIDCVEAVDGLDGVRQARELGPDIIILDLCMPKLNGMQTAASLHRMLPKVPIILYTMHKEIVPENQVQNAGIRAVVSKTDQIGVLLEQIQRYAGIASTASA
jgi:DNA-binding NarL/FixJ family response regulator